MHHIPRYADAMILLNSVKQTPRQRNQNETRHTTVGLQTFDE